MQEICNQQKKKKQDEKNIFDVGNTGLFPRLLYNKTPGRQILIFTRYKNIKFPPSSSLLASALTPLSALCPPTLLLASAPTPFFAVPHSPKIPTATISCSQINYRKSVEYWREAVLQSRECGSLGKCPSLSQVLRVTQHSIKVLKSYLKYVFWGLFPAFPYSHGPFSAPEILLFFHKRTSEVRQPQEDGRITLYL